MIAMLARKAARCQSRNTRRLSPSVIAPRPSIMTNGRRAAVGWISAVLCANNANTGYTASRNG